MVLSLQKFMILLSFWITLNDNVFDSVWKIENKKKKLNFKITTNSDKPVCKVYHQFDFSKITIWFFFIL